MVVESPTDVCSECGKPLVYEPDFAPGLEWAVEEVRPRVGRSLWFFCSGERKPHTPTQETNEAIESIRSATPRVTHATPDA